MAYFREVANAVIEADGRDVDGQVRTACQRSRGCGVWMGGRSPPCSVPGQTRVGMHPKGQVMKVTTTCHHRLTAASGGAV